MPSERAGCGCGFADPLVLTFLDVMGVEYGVATGKNPVLNRLAEPAMQHARKLSEVSGQTGHRYGEGRCAAESWLSERHGPIAPGRRRGRCASGC